MSFDIPHSAGRVLRALAAAGYEAYLVGGCVRDLLRGEAPHDWDICTSARPEEMQACFAGWRVLETGLKHGTVTVLEGGGACEITTYRAEGPYSDHRRPDYVRFVSSLEQDLARRDFTMNAMAMDLSGALRDLFGGADDIKNGLIRCVGEPARRFREDGLRVMRALRFAAVLGCEIEEATARAIHENRSVLGRVSAERINAELRRLLTGPAAGDILRQYPDVLCEFWPELGPLVTLEQHSPWHRWGGWEHTVRAVEAAPPDVTLRLAMLLHDAGKPGCKTTDEWGIDHFYGHPAAGAELARGMLRALKFDNATTKRVAALVELHDARLIPRDQAARRQLSRLGPEMFFQLLAVQRADGMAQAPERAAERLARLDAVRALAERILAERQCLTRGELAVDGRDVIAAGTAPGPQVGRILEELLERVLSGELPNRREALLDAIQKMPFQTGGP